MKLRYKIFTLFLILIDLILILKIAIGDKSLTLLNPQGLIALQERNLMLTSVFIMLLVAIPIVGFVFFTAWKYQNKNTTANFKPEWDHSTKLQILIWLGLFTVILVLSFFNWQTAHKLDPHKELSSNIKPLEIQVVSLRWKWLFIYPEEKIATVNFVAFPEKTPLNFKLTSDGPMNSFWIPQLGGQIYTMTGMVTPLHLIASSTGEYSGSTAELSGAGFAGMHFKAKSLSKNEYNKWIELVKKNNKTLDHTTYELLAKPSEDNPQEFFGSTENDLYNKIINKDMDTPKTDSHDSKQMTGM